MTHLNWRPLVVLAKICLRADPRRIAVLVACELLGTALKLLAAFGVKLEVDAVLRGDPRGAVAAAVVMALALTGAGLTAQGYLRLTDRVIDSAALVIDERLMRLSAGIPTIDHHERGRYLDEMTSLREDRQVMPQMVNALVVNLRVVGFFSGALALLAWIDPLLALLPVAGVALLLAHRVAKRLSRRARRANAPLIRARDHLFKVATSPESGTELRLFGLAPELARRHLALSERADAVTLRAALRGWAATSLAAVVVAAAFGTTIAVVLGGATGAGIGSAVLALTLVGLVNAQLSAAAATAAYLHQVVETGERLLWLEEHAESRRDPPATTTVPATLRDGIRLSDVSFRYPDSERTVLHGIDLRLPAGACVALVGENGSGKSTLVKLLARMYRPTAGSITVDGVPVEAFDVEDWRRATTAGFQDFVRFELAVREGVGLGNHAARGRDLLVDRAIRRAGAHGFVSALPRGADTPLGARWPEAVGLSGGQWQKLALARALTRPAPLLAMMDEPAASLDAVSEHELFKRLVGMRSAAQTHGGVLLFVSHRFATVRAADLVVVLDQGRVSQVGTHDALVAGGGLYAELYEMQARVYR
ncbi:ABC transporter ATP-binding protein [Actinosynnema sp. NPDC050801]|uniref:ABC transporter ATP-binding protein n=1 Tax=unclassified Actinosynnema TaxID=2637065 RepID=UPI00340524E2